MGQKDQNAAGQESALALFEQDLADLTDQQRSACEKIFAALLAEKGCLRKQRRLRDRLEARLDALPAMRLHGPRLFEALRAGLPFAAGAARAVRAGHAAVQPGHVLHLVPNIKAQCAIARERALRTWHLQRWRMHPRVASMKWRALSVVPSRVLLVLLLLLFDAPLIADGLRPWISVFVTPHASNIVPVCGWLIGAGPDDGRGIRLLGASDASAAAASAMRFCLRFCFLRSASLSGT